MRALYTLLDSEQSVQIQHLVDSSSTVMVLRHLLHTHQNDELDLDQLFYRLVNLPVGSYGTADLQWITLRLTLQMLINLLKREGYNWRLIEYATCLTECALIHLAQFGHIMGIHIFFSILRFYLWVEYDADGFLTKLS